MKNKIIVLLVVVAIAIVAFFSFGVNKENDEQKIIMGSQGTDTQVWEHIAKSKEDGSKNYSQRFYRFCIAG
ncbi:hypothetical protein QS460_08400 [Liquorilactobacillus mali]|uniref:Uncharacterized protein n=1 Tax=Liquorilactobacillus mali TaxID=1618 RepID=A0A0R2FWK7_9LACO|nr:hypothetical protein [Liquorilactobacillus mali]KRN29911.1 hypothetical protein IV36_GL000326 [Liquorilactobacillus mali]MDN7145948.1 hypothetical protein [Liquorilactobacillus mali]